jgi:hypothetical protein
MTGLYKILGLGFAALNLPANASTEEKKPNILWIIADDLGTDLACYGNKNVKTPNTGRLAAEGITFTQAYTVVPVSSPSRSCLMTGMYPVSIDCHQHRTLKKDPLPDGILPVTEYFRKAISLDLRNPRYLLWDSYAKYLMAELEFASGQKMVDQVFGQTSQGHRTAYLPGIGN